MDKILYYGFVKHHFPGSIGEEPFDSYVRVAHGSTEKDISDWFTKGRLCGQRGHCYELIYWASGGLYWDDELKKGVLNGPAEFTVNIWKKIDDYNLESVFDLTFKGVKWTSVRHASNAASNCWGLAHFTFSESIENIDYQYMKCCIPSSVQHPSLELGKLMAKHAYGNYVCSTY